jgi:hypothetical protein
MSISSDVKAEVAIVVLGAIAGISLFVGGNSSIVYSCITAIGTIAGVVAGVYAAKRS